MPHASVRVDIDGNRVANAPLECRTILVDIDAGRAGLEIWTGTQNPNGLRAGLAGLLDLPVNQIHVRNTDIGGSFGQKDGSDPRTSPSPRPPSSCDAR